MADARVAKRYARALFSASLKNDSMHTVDQELAAIAAAFSGNARFKNFLTSPIHSASDKLAFIESSFGGGKISRLTFELLKLLIAKSREPELYEVHIFFAELRRDHDKQVLAHIESAQPLDDAQRSAIIAKIEQSTGRTVEPEYSVDESLIGGVRITFDNYVLDGTVRGELNKLRERLIYDVLKQS